MNSDGLIVLGVNCWDEPKDVLKRFVRQENVKFRVLLDGSAVCSRYGVTSVPSLVWIDREGGVADAAVGAAGPEALKARTGRVVSTSH